MKVKPVSDDDYRRASKSLHVPFIEEISARIMESEGDTRRYWDLRQRAFDLQFLHQHIDALVEQKGTS